MTAPDLTADHPAVEAAAASYARTSPARTDALEDMSAARREQFMRRAHQALTAALPHLTGDEPEAPAGPAGPVTPPPVLRIPSRVGSPVHLYPRGHDINPEAHGLPAVAPAVHSAAVLVVTSPDPRTGRPTTVPRYLTSHHARQLGRALIAAADYADHTDHEETRP